VEASIAMDQACIGAGAQVTRAILDEGVCIPAGYQVGGNPERDRRRFVVTEGGITIVPAGAMLE
jgi:glucose-1-phosphate adenylyltransferase